MANNDLAIKFSNDVYATKSEVISYMKTPMIDSIWNSILEYRSHFNKILELRHITNSNYSICLTPQINEKVNNIEKRMMRIYSQYLRLTLSKTDITYKKLAYKEILMSFAKNYSLTLDEVSLNRIFAKNVSSIPPELMIVYHYYLALEDLETNFLKEYDENTLKHFISIIQGIDVTTFRNNEVNNSISKSLVNKLYLGIPTTSINKSMNDLLSFIKDSSLSSFIKGVASLYYIYYVKPFDVYSEEVGVLTLKYILANEGFDELAATFNFESLLDDKEKLEEIILESQKTLDLTYLLVFILDKASEIIDSSFKLIGNAKANEINKEIFVEEKNTEVMPDLSELNNSANLKVSQKENGIEFNQNIAISNVSSGLNEEDAKKLEEHLREMNPSLSAGQAYFYARHCTIGMSYTIAQYKKEVGCAYETARISMDNLVFFGYYRKEPLKNKYIYIPVKKN